MMVCLLGFVDVLVSVSPKKGKRPSFRASEMWTSVATHLPFVDTWQGSEHKSRKNKHSAEALRDAANGHVAKIASNRGAESRNVVNQFFKFVKMTCSLDQGQEFVPSVQHLLSKITVDAFTGFYAQYAGSSQTAANTAKILTRLYYHMQVRREGFVHFTCTHTSCPKTLERFQRFGARVQAIITGLLKFVQQMKQKYSLEKARRGLDSHLLLRGEWLKVNYHHDRLIFPSLTTQRPRPTNCPG
jgi:hypothetical protein